MESRVLSASPRSATSPFATYSSYSAFHLPSSSSSSASDDDDGALPFPTALSRKDFLAPDFDPTNYLSSLFPSEDGTTSIQRHQTLEDLRAELRERSSTISAELLELVNANYTSFLSLGEELRGGDEKVEDIRVALFGFRRAIADVQTRVKERSSEVGDACYELGSVQSSIDFGRRLLELDERVGLVEGRLAIASNNRSGSVAAKFADELAVAAASVWDMDESDEDDGDSDGPANEHISYVTSGPKKLLAIAQDLVLAKQLADSLGHGVLFVAEMQERLLKCKSTLLLDLNSAVKEAIKAKKANGAQLRLLNLLAVYRVLDSEGEVVRVFKEA